MEEFRKAVFNMKNLNEQNQGRETPKWRGSQANVRCGKLECRDRQIKKNGGGYNCQRPQREGGGVCVFLKALHF